jgi:tyrosinase
LNTGDPRAVQTAIANRVNQLYGSSVFGLQAFALPASAPAGAAGTTTAQKPVVRAAPAPAQHVLAALPTASQPAAVPHVPISIPSHPLYDWTCRIEFKKYEIGSSCSVLIFLGDVPNDPSQWRRSPNYVGAHYAFVNGNAGDCENCRSQGDIAIEGFVHLNHAIIVRAGPDLKPGVVEPYLKQHLKWRVQKVWCCPKFDVKNLMHFFTCRLTGKPRISALLK